MATVAFDLLRSYPDGGKDRCIDNEGVCDPLDQWMDFFRNAFGSNPADLRERLKSPVFEEAIGVLEMISRTPEQRRIYNERLKLQLDENTIRQVHEAELQASEARGEARAKAANIRKLLAALGEDSSGGDSLDELPISELDRMASELIDRLRSQRS